MVDIFEMICVVGEIHIKSLKMSFLIWIRLDITIVLGTGKSFVMNCYEF